MIDHWSSESIGHSAFFQDTSLAQVCLSSSRLCSVSPMAPGLSKKRPAGKAFEGGRHQFDSQLALVLVNHWAWGHKPAVELQRECAAALEDQYTLLRRLGLSLDFASKSLKALADLGTGGLYPNSIKRDLVTFLGEACFPEPICEAVPMTILKPKARHDADTDVAKVDFPIVLPHTYLAFMYEHLNNLFVDQWLGGDANGMVLEKFCREFEKRGDPRLAGHNFNSRPDWRRKAIPIMVHGDAVPCISIGRPSVRSYDVFSFQPLLGRGSTKILKVYVYGNFPQNEAGEETMYHVWTKLMHSFQTAYHGVHPTEDSDHMPYAPGSVEGQRAGHHLASGYFLIIWSIKSDMEHLTRFFGLPHYASNMPCPWCPCQAGKHADFEMLFSNFTNIAAWMSLLYSHVQWHTQNPDPHYIFQIMYLSALNVEPDELHTMHLGTSAYFLGSILWILIYEILPDTPARNMITIWKEITDNYKQLRTACQFNNLVLSSFCRPDKHDKDFPKLKGKGAEIRDLMEPMLLVWQKHCRNRNSVDKSVLSGLQCMCKLQAILHEYKDDPFLPVNTAKLFTGHVNRFLQEY